MSELRTTYFPVASEHILWQSFALMQDDSTRIDVENHNQLLDDFLSAAHEEEVHINDIAWFLQLDPYYINYWMKKQNKGNWINGKNQFWWKWQERSS